MMKRIFLLRNPIREYEWGSNRALSELLGVENPSGKPQAELWMGAHPSAPSSAEVDGGWIPLPELIRRAPEEILGVGVARRFAGMLPFLFKVIAAARPLSLQVHPGIEQARAGFAREEASGIPIDARNRCYRDPNHKPEIVCALTPFRALVGFRRVEAVVELLSAVGARDLGEGLAALRSRPDEAGLERLFARWMTMEAQARRRVIARCVEHAARHRGEPIFECLLELEDAHPGDAGVLAPLLLNLVTLEPEQALYLPPGELHAYLGGLALELMASSDNVVRGGLTSKHVDVPELLRTLTFEASDAAIQAPVAKAGGERIYETPAREFRLSVIRLEAGEIHVGAAHRSVEILICTAGRGMILAGAERLALARGRSILIAAALPSYRIEGELTLHKASVPHEHRSP